MSSRVIKLRSADGSTFEVEEKAAMVSQTLKHMIEDGMADGDKVIPIPNVTSATLCKVLEYCRKHAADSGSQSAVEGSGGESTSAESLKDWGAQFVKIADIAEIGSLFELINAANYLHIKDLQDLSCQAAAEMIKDRSVEEVRDIFNIENDYTEEEEAELRRQNAWAFDI